MTNNSIDAYIKAGGYKGLAIDQTISDDEIDMKLDAMTASQKMHINADPIYHVLADFVAILDQAYRATGVRRSHAQVQSEALDIMLLTLSKDQQEVSNLFAGRSASERAERFDRIAWETGDIGQPILTGATAVFECRLATALLWETHHILVGRVAAVRLSGNPSALLYGQRAYRRAIHLAGDS